MWNLLISQVNVGFIYLIYNKAIKTSNYCQKLLQDLFLFQWTLSSMNVHELIVVGPMCITLHFEVLSFNLSNHSIRLYMPLYGPWCRTAENNTWTSFILSANRNSSGNLYLGKSFINNIIKVVPKALPWGTPLMTNVEVTGTCCLLLAANLLPKIITDH